LYRVEAGATCIVTTACVLAGLPYDAEGIAETDIQAQALPIGRFFQLLGQSATFREFVFRAFGTRIADLLMLIEEVAFGRIDQRLASHLLERSRGRGTLRVTHHDLAVDLGTAREVVSRQLKEFERKGWVILARGQIELAEVAALQALVTNT
jgi:CRP/FNR family transcriptional regulator